MKISIKPGKYIVAVSGGVDSVVLLDLLRAQSELELVVAHFNHGMRALADADEQFVRELAQDAELPFALGKASLGKNASEDLARRARHAFLAEVKEDFEASSIIIAHHQDDLIETALINLLRGTGPKGLIALEANAQILRPLTVYTKADILTYAKTHHLPWREDESNAQTDYLRNYLRHKILPRLEPAQKQKLLATISQLNKNTKLKDELVEKVSQAVNKEGAIDRSKFIQLPVDVGGELVAHWLREKNYRDFSRQKVEKTNMLLRTAAPGTKHPLKKGLWLEIGRETARFQDGVN